MVCEFAKCHFLHAVALWSWLWLFAHLHAHLDSATKFCENWIRNSGRKPCKNVQMDQRTHWQSDLYNLPIWQINYNLLHYLQNKIIFRRDCYVHRSTNSKQVEKWHEKTKYHNISHHFNARTCSFGSNVNNIMQQMPKMHKIKSKNYGCLFQELTVFKNQFLWAIKSM